MDWGGTINSPVRVLASADDTALAPFLPPVTALGLMVDALLLPVMIIPTWNCPLACAARAADGLSRQRMTASRHMFLSPGSRARLYDFAAVMSPDRTRFAVGETRCRSSAEQQQGPDQGVRPRLSDAGDRRAEVAGMRAGWVGSYVPSEPLETAREAQAVADAECRSRRAAPLLSVRQRQRRSDHLADARRKSGTRLLQNPEKLGQYTSKSADKSAENDRHEIRKARTTRSSAGREYCFTGQHSGLAGFVARAYY